MPGMDIAGTAPTPAEGPDRPLIRSHKSLPRRTSVAPSVQVTHVSPVDQPQEDSLNGAVVATAPALPLTPPGTAQEETPTNNEKQMQKSASSHSVTGAMTPSKPSHPPTPETTPPRLTPTVNRPGLSQFGHYSASSRAESFKTAYEMISDGETETPRRSSRSSSRSTKQRVSQRTSRPESGDAKSLGTTPTGVSSVDRADTSKVESSLQQMRNAQRTSSGPYEAKPSNTGSPSAVSRPRQTAEPHDLNARRTREKPLKKRARGPGDPKPSPSMEQFREAIGWPSVESRVDSDDTRRFSAASASSTIEAIIIDSPRPSKRTLRHTEKRSSLRSASSPIPKSQRTSLVSNPDSQHRLIHKAARITENDRRSIASEISTCSSTLGAPPQHVDVIRVVVIPERRSSLHSSASVSRNPSKASRRSSRRAPTISGSRPGSPAPHRRQRTVSDPSLFAGSRESSRGRSFGPPVIPPRSSSLSAPTSRTNSRTTSLTSESLHHHTLAMDRETQKQKQQEEQSKEPVKRGPSGLGLTDVGDLPKTQSILIGVEDMAHLRPPSAPFTQLSIPSSSPGPIEINEARTIAFFPHNNESLLLVDPQAQSIPQAHIPRVVYPANLEKPQTPETQIPCDVDSPLKNPRRPPKPPVVRANSLAPAAFEIDQTEETRNDRPTRRFGSFRRPWAARPRSDSFNSFARSLSLKSAKNRKAGQDIDERLDPFWRPRRFWEDSSETEDSPRDEPPQMAEQGQYISNSLGLPQQRLVFEGPRISPRSPSHPKRPTYRYHASKGSLLGSKVFTPEALYSQTSLHPRRFRSLSWWRLRLRFGRVGGVHKRLRRNMHQRAEGKREARRERLKQSIGEAVLVGSSTQTRSMAITQ